MPGESLHVGKYRLQYEKPYRVKDDNKMAVAARLTVYKNGRELGRLVPQRYFYWEQQQPTTEVALRSTLKEDLYVVLAGLTEEGEATMQAYVNPLVSFIWIGGVLNILGTLIAISPTRRPRRWVGRPALPESDEVDTKVKEAEDRELVEIQ